MRAAIVLVFLVLLGLPALAAPKVVASIVPVHALVAGVMEGAGKPELLLSGQNSEHQASYSPQQLQSLAEADLVFMVGGGLELKLDELSGSEAVKGKTFIALAESEGLRLLAIREGGAWAAHDHDEAEGHGHEHEKGKAEFDPHLWLDPDNAKVMVARIAAELSKADAEHASLYQANANRLAAELDGLSNEIAALLLPVKDRPYVVFHDAYQYVDARFGLAGVGSISDFSATAPSAKRLKEVRNKIADVGAICVFREPQFSDAAVKIVIEGTAAKAGVLDPIGSTLQPGRNAYRDLMKTLAQNLRACLLRE